MNVEQAYNEWALQYDTNENKTRDLERQALRELLGDQQFNKCLEVGCGTGKNTEWLITKAEVTAVDFSAEMLAKARQKINSDKVLFVQADITKDWSFVNEAYDLVTFSLVLEHIKDLNTIFKKVSASLATNGLVYVGELHPFKQYAGSKARFENEDGLQVVDCYTHNISDFISAAKQNRLVVETVSEYFDGNDRTSIPRILAIVFKKQSV